MECRAGVQRRCNHILSHPTGLVSDHIESKLLISCCRYNRYLAVAARVVRRSLKEDIRIEAERRGEMDLRFAKWEVRDEYSLFAMLLLLISDLRQGYFAVGNSFWARQCIKPGSVRTKKTTNANP